MADLLTVKKKAQEYQYQCETSGLVRMTQVTLALLAAIGAVVCAFGGLHEADRVFSTAVVITILWEVIGYGFHQWQGIRVAARGYKRLAADIQVGAKDLAAAQAELAQLGDPDVGVVVGEIGSIATSMRWGVQTGRAFLLPLLFCVLVAAVVVGAAFTIEHFVPHFHAAAGAAST